MASIYNTMKNDVSNRQTIEKTYISLVKIRDRIWSVAKSESTNLQEHIDYIESIRNRSDVEEAKVMEFKKITGYVNQSSSVGSGSPTITQIKLR